MAEGPTHNSREVSAPRPGTQWNPESRSGDSSPPDLNQSAPSFAAFTPATFPDAQHARPGFPQAQHARPGFPQAQHARPAYSAASFPDARRGSRLNWFLLFAIGCGVITVVASFADGGAERAPERSFIEIPAVEPAGAAGAMPLDEAEAFVSALGPFRDADDSYVESALVMTRAFGAELIWADSDSIDPTSFCASNPDPDNSVLAWYCGLEPYLIRLNGNNPNMPAELYEPEFVDVVKHELAHLVIHQRCGRSAPTGDSVDIEGVANSYAVFYLGAHRSVLGERTSPTSEYAMTGETDTAAILIHGGTCS